MEVKIEGVRSRQVGRAAELAMGNTWSCSSPRNGERRSKVVTAHSFNAVENG